MYVGSLASTLPLLIGNPPAVSFGLLFIFTAVFLVALLSVLSAVFDMVLYAGGVSLIIGAIFHFSDTLSLTAGWEYITTLLGM